MGCWPPFRPSCVSLAVALKLSPFIGNYSIKVLSPPYVIHPHCTVLDGLGAAYLFPTTNQDRGEQVLPGASLIPRRRKAAHLCAQGRESVSSFEAWALCPPCHHRKETPAALLKRGSMAMPKTLVALTLASVVRSGGVFLEFCS